MIAAFLHLFSVGLLAVGAPQSAAATHSPAREASSAASQGSSAQEPTYGATPEDLRPYRNADHVYWRYFETPPQYRGAGREEPVPEGLESFKIGLLAPIQGGRDVEIGRAILDGVTLALEQANAGGGFAQGVPFELVVRNDAATWGDSSNTLADLAWRERVWAVIGSVDGASTHVALRVALKAEVMMVNTACTDQTLTETAIPWIVRNYPDDRQHGYRLAHEVFGRRGLERVALLRSNDKYGRMGVKEFSDAARRMGHPIVVEQRFPPGDPDVEDQLARIREANVDGIVLWGDPGDLGRIAARIRELSFEQPLFGPERLQSPRFLAAAGAAAEGVTITSPLDPGRDDPVWLEFVERFQQRFGRAPDSFAAASFDGAQLLIRAARRAGANRARIRDELFTVTEYPGLMGPVRLDASFTQVGGLHVLQVRDGRFVRLPER